MAGEATHHHIPDEVLLIFQPLAGGRSRRDPAATATLGVRPFRRLCAVLALSASLGAIVLVPADRAAAQGSEAPALTAFANAPGAITLNWSHSGDGVYWFVIEQESPATYREVDAGKRVFTVVGLQADTTYRYRVCAVYDYNRVCSDYATVRTMAPERPGGRPGIPAGAASFRLMASRLYMRHNFHFGKVTPVNGWAVSPALDRSDATFVMRPGLSGTPGSVSFESLNYPGEFLRHNFFQIKLHRNDGTELFRKDASFIKRKSPYWVQGEEARTVRFESVNVPGSFIRARWVGPHGADSVRGQAELWIDRVDGSANTEYQMAFVEEPPLAESCVRWNGPCPSR